MQEKSIREEIFCKVKDFYNIKRGGEEFIPGKTLINYAGRVYDQDEIKYLIDASLDFWLTAGRYAEEFEKNLAEYLGLKYCLLTNSGSSANLLAVTALTSPKLEGRRLRPGDEVITTACGFPTTLNPIIQNSLIPVFIDIDLNTFNIKAEELEKAVSKKTKAIFVAHTLGNPVNLEKILQVVKKYNLWFIEDNCDSLGSRYRNRYTGSFGHLSTCSFYPAHHITMGEGGAVLTSDPVLFRIILSLRDWGRDCWCLPGNDNTCKRRFSQHFGNMPVGYDHKYIYSHIGYNLKVTDMQAAIGVAQLKKLNSFIKIRKINYEYLRNFLGNYRDYFTFASCVKYAEPSWFGFPIMVKEEASFTRNEIVKYLEENKIATRMLFGGNLICQPAYKGIRYRIYGNLSNTDLVMNNLFWIGVYPGITKDKLKYIVKVFNNFLRKY